MTYADHTNVPPDRSMNEIRALLRQRHADPLDIRESWRDREARITFGLDGRCYQIVLPLPDPDDPAFATTESGRYLRAPKARQAYEQEVRRRWRVLLIVVKAKLEAAASGVSTLEEEFLAALLLPDGRTVGELAAPEVAQAYATGRMPAGLLTGG